MRAAALCDGPHFHLLDHLAPLCYYLNIPLITDHEVSYELAQKHWPNVTTYLIRERYLEYLSDSYDLLITTSKFTRIELTPFLPKDMRFVFCPHGNSDKLLDIFDYQTHALTYGPQMEQRLKHKPLMLIRMGNLRYAYFKEFQKPYPHVKPTTLYAPTWDDEESLSSFHTHYKKLIEDIEGHLIIKLHPLTEKYYPSDTYYLLGEAERRCNLTVLYDYPPVYPVLAACDRYIGDYSSVGYDYLAFNRPMSFLKTNKMSELQKGISYSEVFSDPAPNLRSILESLIR